MDTRRLKILSAYLFFLLLFSLTALFVACNDPTQRTTSSDTTQHNQPTPRPTVNNTPQPIPANSFTIETGWQEVMHLGKIQNHTIQTQGSFVSTHAYRILAICDGTGTITIQYAPQGSSTMQCHQTPLLQSVDVQNPPAKETVNVSVITQATNIWEVSVQEAK